MATTETRTTDRLDGVQGNLKLIEIAETSQDPAEQVELARHESGLVHAALRGNKNLCSAAKNILDGKEPEPQIDDTGVQVLIEETRTALGEK